MAETQKGAERRKHTRVPVKITLEDIFELDAFTSAQKGTVVDMSLSGLGLISPDHFETDTNIVFSFALPNSMKISNIRGNVVWSRHETEGWSHGIRFIRYGLFNYVKLWWYLNMSFKNP